MSPYTHPVLLDEFLFFLQVQRCEVRVFERMAMSCVLISVLCTQICVGTEAFLKLRVSLCSFLSEIAL